MFCGGYSPSQSCSKGFNGFNAMGVGRNLELSTAPHCRCRPLFRRPGDVGSFEACDYSATRLLSYSVHSLRTLRTRSWMRNRVCAIGFFLGLPIVSAQTSGFAGLLACILDLLKSPGKKIHSMKMHKIYSHQIPQLRWITLR